MSRADVEEAIRQVLQGRAEPFAVVVAAYHRQVRALATVLVGDSDDALEITQETFVFAFEHVDQYEPDTNCLAWVRAITRNLCRDHMKRRASRMRLMQSHIADTVARRSYELVGAERVDARIEQLERCVEELGGDQRRLLRDAHGRESSIDDLARRLGRSGAAVRQQISRLHRFLRECIRRHLTAADGRA